MNHQDWEIDGKNFDLCADVINVHWNYSWLWGKVPE